MIFGGEGYRLDDAGEGPSPCVYILDVDSLTWHRCITHSPVEAHSPGARSLHVTTVRPLLLASFRPAGSLSLTDLLKCQSAPLLEYVWEPQSLAPKAHTVAGIT